jgi:hypothetical protein
VDSTGGIPKSILRYIERVTVSGAHLILSTSRATHQVRQSVNSAR